MPYYIFYFNSEEQPSIDVEAPTQEVALEQIKTYYSYRANNLEGKLVRVEERQLHNYEIEFSYTVTIKLHKERAETSEEITKDLKYYAYQDPYDFEQAFDADWKLGPIKLLSVKELEDDDEENK